MKNKFVNLLIILFLIIFSISIVEKEFQNDTYFTIIVGQKIINEGIYENETFTFHEGLKYQNVRWLFDLTIGLIYNQFGFLGIYVFVLLITSCISLCLYYCMRKMKIRREIAFLFVIIIMYLSKVGMCARAQIISFLLFIIEYYFINKLMEKNEKKYIFGIALVGLILPNVHASVFPIYFLFFVPYFAEWLLSKSKIIVNSSNKIVIENRNIMLLIISLILGIGCSFITPINYAQYLNMFKTIGQISSDFIVEMLPLDIINEFGFTFMIIWIIGLIGFTKIKVKIVDIFYLFGFGLLSLSNTRSVFLFYLICGIIIAKYTSIFLDEYKFPIIKLNKQFNKILIIGILLIYSLFLINKFIKINLKEYVDTSEFPVDASNFILLNYNMNDIRLYNDFDNGSYLEYVGIPVFLDSRAEIYLSTFNDCTILNDYVDCTYQNKYYQDIFNKYNINLALIKNSDKINRDIYRNENWKLVYQDDSYSLYERLRGE